MGHGGGTLLTLIRLLLRKLARTPDRSIGAPGSEPSSMKVLTRASKPHRAGMISCRRTASDQLPSRIGFSSKYVSLFLLRHAPERRPLVIECQGRAGARLGASD